MQPHGRQPTRLPVPGILQARTLEWVAISFSNAWKWKVKMKLLSRVRLLAIPRMAAHQAPPSMGFSSQEYWSGVPLPSPALLLTLDKSVNPSGRQFSFYYLKHMILPFFLVKHFHTGSLVHSNKMSNRFFPSTNDLWVYYRVNEILSKKSDFFLGKKSPFSRQRSLSVRLKAFSY